MNRTRPILRWPGGKTRMLKHLLPIVQATPHVCYNETCAGGLALLMAKERSPVEVVNDVNGDLVALYRNLQFHLPEIVRQMKGKWIVTVDDSPLNRDLFSDCKLTALVTRSGTVNKRLSAGKTFGELIIQPA